MATPTNLPNTFSTGQVLTAAQMNDLRGAFRVLQVVSTTKTDTFTTTSTTYTDVTGVSVTITPQSTASKILILCTLSAGSTVGGTNTFAQLVRGSTAISLGNAAGTRYQMTNGARDQDFQAAITMNFLDSPSTTSATTYKVQVRTQGAGTIFVNRNATDTDTVSSARGTSTITVFEVSA